MVGEQRNLESNVKVDINQELVVYLRVTNILNMFYEQFFGEPFPLRGPCPMVFPGFPVLLPPQKATFLNSNSIGNKWDKRSHYDMWRCNSQLFPWNEF